MLRLPSLVTHTQLASDHSATTDTPNTPVHRSDARTTRATRARMESVSAIVTDCYDSQLDILEDDRCVARTLAVGLPMILCWLE